MMSPLPTIVLLRRYAIGVSLVVLLMAVYLVTYSGYAISQDEWFLFDATESIARRGDLRQNFELDHYPPLAVAETQLPAPDSEPLQPILAASFFLAAQYLPAVGLAHTVWLFNIVVTAMTAGVLYALGLARGYRARVAVLVALLFGLGTVAWPYSRTFFREPLFTLLSIMSVYLLERIRQRFAANQRPVILILTFALVFSGMMLSKEAALLVIPTLIVVVFPAHQLTRSTVVMFSILALMGVALLLIMLNLDTWFDVAIARWDLTHRMQQVRTHTGDISEGVRGYLLSPGRSMWLYSPVLLLGFFGWRRLGRTQRWREILVPLVAIASFVLGYAAVRGDHTWYGGLGWGPRYLVPVTPVVALWLLPVVQALLERATAWWKRLGAGIVALVSILIQIVAALVPIEAYYNLLAAQDPVVYPWLDGTWTVRWSPFYVYPQLLDDQRLDLAWLHATGPSFLFPVLATTLAVLASGALIVWLRYRPEVAPHTTRRYVNATAGTLTVALCLTLFSSLYVIRQDPRYFGDFDPLLELLSDLERDIQPGDAVVLNDYFYSEFFKNYFKKPDATVYTLLLSPGERHSPDEAPEVESAYSDALMEPVNTVILNRLAQQHKRIWLVIDSSPFIGWSTRPVEEYLARHYFPMREIKATDTARAVLFDTSSAPPSTTVTWPTKLPDVQFGDSLRLIGYDIPGGTTRATGDSLPVSLLWKTVAPSPENYTIALLLLRDGELVAQRDSFPVNHFEFTSAWRQDSFHRDNHALELSDNLAPGEYELWLAIYWWQAPSERIPVMDEDGTILGDHLVLETIIIE